jgi:hypothetical protein
VLDLLGSTPWRTTAGVGVLRSSARAEIECAGARETADSDLALAQVATAATGRAMRNVKSLAMLDLPGSVTTPGFPSLSG